MSGLTQLRNQQEDFAHGVSRYQIYRTATEKSARIVYTCFLDVYYVNHVSDILASPFKNSSRYHDQLSTVIFMYVL